MIFGRDLLTNVPLIKERGEDCGAGGAGRVVPDGAAEGLLHGDADHPQVTVTRAVTIQIRDYDSKSHFLMSHESPI